MYVCCWLAADGFVVIKPFEYLNFRPKGGRKGKRRREPAVREGIFFVSTNLNFPPISLHHRLSRVWPLKLNWDTTALEKRNKGRYIYCYKRICVIAIVWKSWLYRHGQSALKSWFHHRQRLLKKDTQAHYQRWIGSQCVQVKKKSSLHFQLCLSPNLHRQHVFSCQPCSACTMYEYMFSTTPKKYIKGGATTFTFLG